MWISKGTFEMLLMENTRLQALAVEHVRQNTAHETTIDWMRAQINQLQAERAQLIFAATGARIPVPRIEPTVPEDSHPLSQMAATFEDVGDDMAKEMGIAHLPDGTLKFNAMADDFRPKDN